MRHTTVPAGCLFWKNLEKNEPGEKIGELIKLHNSAPHHQTYSAQ
jgi:hypothetical protein